MDADPAQVQAGLTKAMGLLTAWNESDQEDQTFAARLLAEYAMEEGTPLEGLALVAAGLLSLSGHLLLEVAYHTEKSPEEVLKIFGRKIAQEG